jgi:hypothetical protein
MKPASATRLAASSWKRRASSPSSTGTVDTHPRSLSLRCKVSASTACKGCRLRAALEHHSPKPFCTFPAAACAD